MEVVHRSGRTWAQVAETFVEYRPTVVSARGANEAVRNPRAAGDGVGEVSKEPAALSEEALDPQNTRLLIRFLHFRPDLAHAYATLRRFGKIRSCFICAKQSKSSVIVDFATKEAAVAVKSTFTSYVTPEGVEARVKIFWGKRHHQKMPWEWKMPSIEEMIGRAEEVHLEQVKTKRCEIVVQQVDEEDLDVEDEGEEEMNATAPATLGWKNPAQVPETRNHQGVGRYPLRLTDPWFQGSDLQRNPRLSLASLLDICAPHWQTPSLLTTSNSQYLGVDSSAESEPRVSIGQYSSDMAPTSITSESDLFSSPRTTVDQEWASSMYSASEYSMTDSAAWLDDTEESQNATPSIPRSTI